MSNWTLAKTALGVLRNPNIWKIGFDLNGLCVTGQRYLMVAKAIEDGKIACEAVDTFKLKPGETLKPGTKIGALYEPDNNTMFFPRENYGKGSVYEQMVILHEATHAMFDLFAKTNDDHVLAIEDEMAATLAQALYLRLCANSESAAARRFSFIRDGSGDLALKLTDRMMAETGDFVRDQRTYFLRPDQTAKLREAVGFDWDFVKENLPNGMTRDSTGVKSIYNGVVRCYPCWVHGKE